MKSEQHIISASDNYEANLSKVLPALITENFFNAIDTDHSESISTKEFVEFIAHAYVSRGLHAPNAADSQILFGKIDVNHSGRVNLQELRSWYNSQISSAAEPGLFFDIATQVTFDKLDRHHNKEVTGTEFVEEIQEFVKSHGLGQIREESIRGAFYGSLNSGEEHFRVRHFQRLAKRYIHEAVQHAAAQAHAHAEEKTWPRISINGLIHHMLVHNFFNAIDTDHNGKISMNEFITFFKQFAYSHGWEAPIPSDVKLLFNLIDLDKNGVISIKEIDAYLNRAVSSGNNVKLFARLSSSISFERLDNDRSGNLSFEEFDKEVQKFATKHKLQSPTKGEIHDAYGGALRNDKIFNINNFNELVSHYALGGTSFTSNENPSAPERLREILTNLMIESLFASMDTNRNGVIRHDEFVNFAKRVSIAKKLKMPTDTNLNNLFNEADGDHNGSITRSELKRFLHNQLKSGHPLGLFVELAANSAFNHLDSNNSGDLSIEEYREGIHRLASNYGINAPTDETINASWRHSIGVRNKFTEDVFLNLIGAQFGLDI